MNAFRVASWSIATILAGCSTSASLVGRYLDIDYGDGLMIVQIDSIEHGSVRGALTVGNMKGNNGVARWTTVPISGTLRDQALNLTISNGGPISSLNGMVVPNGLELTMQWNGRPVRHIFKREDNAAAGNDA